MSYSFHHSQDMDSGANQQMNKWAGEEAQCVGYLLYKCENWSLNSQHLHETQAWLQEFINPGQGVWGCTEIAGFSELLASQHSTKNKVQSQWRGFPNKARMLEEGFLMAACGCYRHVWAHSNTHTKLYIIPHTPTPTHAHTAKTTKVQLHWGNLSICY